jgi:guanylate kinase
MLILIGPSASGKTEVAKLLISKHGLKKLVTYTTRPIRTSETDGVDYHFLSAERFFKLKDAGEFVETTCYNGNFYGSRKCDVCDDKVVVLEANGLNAFLKQMPDKIVSVFLETPKAIRKQRMIDRGDDPRDIERRLASDDVLFDKSRFERIDFTVENIGISLEELTGEIAKLYRGKCSCGS